jgi:hypothetical protein
MSSLEIYKAQLKMKKFARDMNHNYSGDEKNNSKSNECQKDKNTRKETSLTLLFFQNFEKSAKRKRFSFYFHHIWNILKVLVSHQIF